MKKLLQTLSKEAIECNPDFFTDQEKAQNYIGRPPATTKAIEAAENKLGLKLPKDVVELYKASNGTAVILNQTFGAFEPIENVGWLRDLNPQLIEDYGGMGEDYSNHLKNAIVIGGLNYVHGVFLIAPFGANKNWKYWEFAHYLPGENAFNGIKQYLERLIDFLKDQNKNRIETEAKNA